MQDAIQVLEHLNQTKTNMALETRTAITKAIWELRMAKNIKEAKQIIGEIYDVMQRDTSITSDVKKRFRTIVKKLSTGSHVTSNLLFTLVIVFFLLKVFWVDTYLYSWWVWILAEIWHFLVSLLKVLRTHVNYTIIPRRQLKQYMFSTGPNLKEAQLLQEKKEEISLSPMTKSSTPTDKYKKQSANTKRHQNVRLYHRWSNNSHPTGVVKPVYGIPNFPLTAKAVSSKGHTFKDV